MRLTMPRCLISAAISRLVHWLIGRCESLGDSQANATIWQTCSAVIVSGLPGRGASIRRSMIGKSSKLAGFAASQRAPAADHIQPRLDLTRNLAVIGPIGRREHDPRSERDLLWCGMATNKLLQFLAFEIGKDNGTWFGTTHRMLLRILAGTTASVPGPII